MFLLALPVDGGWSSWTAWSACGKTCRGSVVMRTRSCSSPLVQRGGKDCPGSDKETAEDCTHSCPGKEALLIIIFI